jgi:hypothetical protein
MASLEWASPLLFTLHPHHPGVVEDSGAACSLVECWLICSHHALRRIITQRLLAAGARRHLLLRHRRRAPQREPQLATVALLVAEHFNLVGVFS